MSRKSSSMSPPKPPKNADAIFEDPVAGAVGLGVSSFYSLRNLLKF